MTTYEPGTVAVATVRGVEGVRVMKKLAATGNDLWSVSTGGITARTDELRDIRPLVVLDLGNPPAFVASLRIAAENDRLVEGPLTNIADQIEAQTKPPRIPEPGLWGVVEAQGANPCMRRWVRYGTGWRDAFGNYSVWSDLIDPTLIREGVESDA